MIQGDCGEKGDAGELPYTNPPDRLWARRRGNIILPAAPKASIFLVRPRPRPRPPSNSCPPATFFFSDIPGTLGNTIPIAVMSGEKRPAQAAFGSANQLVVKRKKSDADLNPGTAVVKGSAQGGALVQSVRESLYERYHTFCGRSRA